jgi:ribosome-associated protein
MRVVLWFPAPIRPFPSHLRNPNVPATDEAVALAIAAADAADDKKATDLTVLDVADVIGLVDVFLLVTTSSDRQLRAVAEGIEERLRGRSRKPLRREGDPAGGWVLLDFGDLVCHLFSTEQREFYALERLWADVPRLDPVTGERSATATGLSAGLHAEPSRGS